MRRRLVLLAVAVLIAAVGAGMVAVYVNGASDTPTAATAKESMVKVLTATSLIDVGETAGQAQTEGKIALTPISTVSVVSGALTSIDTMADQVALSPIYPGEQILALKFGTTAASELLLPVPKGKIGIAVELNDPGRVAGFVTPGSRVCIFVTMEASSDPNSPEGRTRVLVSDVLVLGVGQTSVISPKDAAADSTAVAQTVLTVALDQRDADRVVFSTITHILWFGLLSEGLKLPPDIGITEQDLVK